MEVLQWPLVTCQKGIQRGTERYNLKQSFCLNDCVLLDC